MYPHCIRLRGPWELDVVSLAGELSTRRVTMPVRWGEVGLEGHAGVVRFRRRFGLPRRRDDWERVWLVVQGRVVRAAWSLNGDAFIPCDSADGFLESEITSRLCERNELAVELTPGDPEELVWEELALEIRCRAFLRGIKAAAERAEDGWLIRVSGEVVREYSGDSLELYALVEGANQDYQNLPAGKPVSAVQFNLPWKSRAESGEVTVRVDLVNVATIWHTAECVVKLDR